MHDNVPQWPPWPSFGELERAAADRVLRSGRLDYWCGGEVRSFEREFAAYCGARHGVAVSSGTAALEVALRAVGVGPGDDVVVPARSFVATASSVVMCGARPMFADVCRESQNMEAQQVLDALTPATRAVVCVHLAGRPCEMEPLLALARERNLRLIEDCAQAHGAQYRGQSVGSFGDAAAFSFCQDKNLTTGGEGGMVLTSHDAVRELAWSFKDHGKDRHGADPSEGLPVYRWIHRTIGTNLRMTELQAAIGRVQLRQLPAWLNARRANATYLDQALAGVAGIRVPGAPAHLLQGCYKYYLFLKRRDPEYRDRVLGRINAAGVPCLQGICPEVYREMAFDDISLHRRGRLPFAAELGETSLMLQIHPGLTLHHMAHTARAVREAMRDDAVQDGAGHV